jgi:hypothetical protein
MTRLYLFQCIYIHSSNVCDDICVQRTKRCNAHTSIFACVHNILYDDLFRCMKEPSTGKTTDDVIHKMKFHRGFRAHHQAVVPEIDSSQIYRQSFGKE